MAHHCKAILITCMDFRLVREMRRWMEKNGYLSNCDVVSLAGASKEIVDGSDEVKDLILKQIELARNLHDVSEVILIHHSDCGAYKSAYNFASSEEEKAKQKEDMIKTEDIIKARFNDMIVTKIWAQMRDGDGNEIDFQVL